GMDRAEIRRLNMIRPEDMPYQTPIGPTYDSGDFPNILDRALASAGYDDFEARRTQVSRSGRLKGIGLACFVESSGVAPSRLAGALGARTGFYESAHIRVDQSGGVKVYLGTHNHGQGHATTFAQIVSDRLGVTLPNIEIIEGDTGLTPVGTGTFGSRSMAVGGSALYCAAGKIVEKGKRLAAHLMETAAADIEHISGHYKVSGTDRSLSFEEIARSAYSAHNYPPEDFEPGLEESAFYDPKNFAYSNGAHVCEIEIDTETGKIDLLGYWVADDIGTVINPMIVEGQIHGGLAQGLGQVLMENAIYDPDNGQLLSGSFMDYAMPLAEDLPDFTSELDQSQPCTHNPLGAKGCGESGAIGAPAAVVSAVMDALRPLGVTELQMPLTPQKLWRAIKEASE
ncbi:MAG: molybdopterin-dependent oxidoreductase, partial [Rhodospirillales bacterium]|nr:molybdopterin-dependent oxidoreductase [Rhodospirillales bacterium]